MNQHSKPVGSSGKSERLPLLSANYFLDTLQMPIADLNDFPDWPSKESASQLVDSYFQVVHASFPFIGKLYFLKQFHAFYAIPGTQPGRAWMTILNMVFAIAARHNSLLRKEIGPEFGAHMLYFSRAWQLCMMDSGVLDHPNLQQVQIESLMSLYMLSIGHINR